MAATVSWLARLAVQLVVWTDSSVHQRGVSLHTVYIVTYREHKSFGLQLAGAIWLAC